MSEDLLNTIEEYEKGIERLKEDNEYLNKVNIELSTEKNRLNNIISRTTKYVQSLSSKGRGCDIYEDIKQEILKELKGANK